MIKLKGGNRNLKPFRNAASVITKEHVSKLNENEKLFDISNFFDLNIANSEVSIDMPYDGLRRSRNIFQNAANGEGNLLYDDIYEKDKPDYHKYCSTMENISRQEKLLNTFKDDIILGQFDFPKHLLTMRSIDAAIESEKIHMIKIIKPKENK